MQLSLTDFVDFAVSNAPIGKANKLAAIKNRPDYERRFDYWGNARDAISNTHKHNLDKSSLDNALLRVTPEKLSNYTAIVDGYKKWWGRKSFHWFDPQTQLFSDSGVDITVNPELGLEFNTERHLVKLYFKSEPLTSRKSEIVTLLMAQTLSQIFPDVKMSILDIRQHKIFTPETINPRLVAALKAELAYIAKIWNDL